MKIVFEMSFLGAGDYKVDYLGITFCCITAKLMFAFFATLDTWFRVSQLVLSRLSLLLLESLQFLLPKECLHGTGRSSELAMSL